MVLQAASVARAFWVTWISGSGRPCSIFSAQKVLCWDNGGAGGGQAIRAFLSQGPPGCAIAHLFFNLPICLTNAVGHAEGCLISELGAAHHASRDNYAVPCLAAKVLNLSHNLGQNECQLGQQMKCHSLPQMVWSLSVTGTLLAQTDMSLSTRHVNVGL